MLEFHSSSNNNNYEKELIHFSSRPLTSDITQFLDLFFSLDFRQVRSFIRTHGINYGHGFALSSYYHLLKFYKVPYNDATYISVLNCPEQACNIILLNIATALMFIYLSFPVCPTYNDALPRLEQKRLTSSIIGQYKYFSALKSALLNFNFAPYPHRNLQIPVDLIMEIYTQEVIAKIYHYECFISKSTHPKIGSSICQDILYQISTTFKSLPPTELIANRQMKLMLYVDGNFGQNPDISSLLRLLSRDFPYESFLMVLNRFLFSNYKTLKSLNRGYFNEICYGKPAISLDVPQLPIVHPQQSIIQSQSHIQFRPQKPVPHGSILLPEQEQSNMRVHLTQHNSTNTSVKKLKLTSNSHHQNSTSSLKNVNITKLVGHSRNSNSLKRKHDQYIHEIHTYVYNGLVDLYSCLSARFQRLVY